MSRRPATSLSAGAYRERLQHDPHDAVRQELRQELLALPVPTFDRLVARLLLACGYRDVQVLEEGRGGADLSATVPSGLSSSLTLVQAKQYVSPVSRRFVDELRGAMLRLGAGQGLLLTTSTFYGPARHAAQTSCPLSVRLIDGPELLDLLLQHRLGVFLSPRGHLALDREFFAVLSLSELGSQECLGPAAPSPIPGLQSCPRCGADRMAARGPTTGCSFRRRAR